MQFEGPLPEAGSLSALRSNTIYPEMGFLRSLESKKLAHKGFLLLFYEVSANHTKDNLASTLLLHTMHRLNS